MIASNIDVFLCCFGHEHISDVFKEAETQNITIQDYTMSCVLAAIEHGMTFKSEDAYDDLCRQLKIDR